MVKHFFIRIFVTNKKQMKPIQNHYTESEASHFPWMPLTTLQQLNVITLESKHLPILIFKHSTRCTISSMVLRRFEKDWDETLQATLYYLDILQYRELSKAVENQFSVTHESPQLLLIIDEKVVYHASHGDIEAEVVTSKIRI